jgi:glycosyltransferase involved in cell wall biosynthesis
VPNDQIDCPGADKILLFVGRLSERKGADILARMLPSLLAADQDLRVLFIGAEARWRDGMSLRACLAGMPERLCARVQIMPHIERHQLPSIYASARVLVFPSLWESFGLVMLEAMACGVPVVAFRSGGPQEVIRDGIDGFLIDLGDDVTFAERIKRLCADDALWRSMRREARQRAVARFDMDTLVAETELLYSQLIDQVV